MTTKGKLRKVDENWMVRLIEDKMSDCKLHPKNINFVESLLTENKIKEGQELNFHVGIDCLKDCMGLCGECDGMQKYATLSELDYKYYER
jgi:hypothetical protein